MNKPMMVRAEKVTLWRCPKCYTRFADRECADRHVATCGDSMSWSFKGSAPPSRLREADGE